MPVVKGPNAKSAVEAAVILDLGDLRREGERLLELARAQAMEIVADAETEAGRIVDAAATRGHVEGLEKGEAEGRAAGLEAGRQAAHAEHAERLAAVESAWTAALAHWEDDRRTMLLDARSDVLTFAFEMARKIVLRVAAQDPRLVERQLEESLALISRPTALSIAVHPDDRALVAEVLPELVGRLGSGADAELLTDEGITRGGCVVRTPGGGIDARIERQIERIAETLLPDHSSADSGSSETHEPGGGAT